MAKEIRVKRVGAFIEKEVSEVILTQLRDEGIKAMVTVFGVEVSNDLRHAKIKLSINSDNEEEIESTRKALIRAKSFIRRSLSKSLKTMYSPEIWFEFISLSESMKVYEKLKEVEKELEEKGFGGENED
jgi:ribosome-binding factor A